MDLPTVLKALSASGAAVKALGAWSRKTRGDTRALVLELRKNLTLLDLVAEDGVPLNEVLGQITTAEHERLAREGFNFNALKRGRIRSHRSLGGTDLARWQKKETADLVESIYSKITDLKLRYPHVSDRKKYRWGIRVNNIRKRIWLLLRHVNADRKNKPPVA